MAADRFGAGRSAVVQPTPNAWPPHGGSHRFVSWRCPGDHPLWCRSEPQWWLRNSTARRPLNGFWPTVRRCNVFCGR